MTTPLLTSSSNSPYGLSCCQSLMQPWLLCYTPSYCSLAGSMNALPALIHGSSSHRKVSTDGQAGSMHSAYLLATLSLSPSLLWPSKSLRSHLGYWPYVSPHLVQPLPSSPWLCKILNIPTILHRLKTSKRRSSMTSHIESGVCWPCCHVSSPRL
jgi:hypothetical protein